MEEKLSVKSRVSCLSDYNEPLVECCVCRRPMSEPVILKCLHSGCQPCLVLVTAEGENSSVMCPVCRESTEFHSIISGSFLCNDVLLSALASETLSCHACDDESRAAAVFWCADCCMALCDSCYSWHNRFNRRHRSAELETARAWSMSQLKPLVQCFMHRRQLEMQCFTCREPKCLLCSESCRASQHELQPLSHDNTRKHSAAVVKSMTSIWEQLCSRVSGLLQKCRDTRIHLEVTHRRHNHGMLARCKRSLQDATLNAFDTSVSEVIVKVEKLRSVCTTIMARPVPLGSSVRFATSGSEARSFQRLERMDFLHKGSLLKGAVHRCASSLTELLKQRKKYWQDNGDFRISGSVPVTSAIVLRSCLGNTERRAAAAAVRAPMRFGQVFVTFRTPVDCHDLAVTRDGHVLLAAARLGLLVFSSLGQQLSHWKPVRHNSGRDDGVMCVAALTDGRAAVGVFYAQLVVLLKLSERGDTWLENCVTVLQSPPLRLAVHTDLLAAAECRLHEQQRWSGGRQVKLLRLSSGQLLYTQSREYDIYRVALTGLCLLTVSTGRVTRSSGATPCVLDAYSHSGEFLWRYETSDEELLTCMCVSTDEWRRVYVAVVGKNGSWSVTAISGSDGRDMGEAISKTQGLQIPWLMSLARGQQRAYLAVLDFDIAVDKLTSVSLYEPKSVEQ